MLTIISPAKTLDFSNNSPKNIKTTEPCFYKEALELLAILEKYSPQELCKLMSISPKLGELNYNRFQEFEAAKQKPAFYA